MKEKEKKSMQENTPEQPSIDDKAQAPDAGDIENLKAQIAELGKSLELSKDQVLRKAAEFENYKRRMENDLSTINRFATEGIILELLPIIDDFTRSLKSGKDRREFGSFYQGVELIYNKFLKILESQGVKPMDVVGKAFNVDFHDALMQMPKEGVAPHTILEEVEKGYMMNDKVLRHAKVIVSSEAQDVPADSGNREKES